MKHKLLLGLLALAMAVTAAKAQNVPYFPQTVPASTVIGRLPGSPGPIEAIPFATFSAALGGFVAYPTTPSAGTVVGTPVGGTAFVQLTYSALATALAPYSPYPATPTASTIVGTPVGGSTFVEMTGAQAAAIVLPALQPFAAPGGRLTLSSGVPVLTSSTVTSSTLYYAPDVHALVPVYNGTTIGWYSFLQSSGDTVGLSLALGSNTLANSVYDVFVFLNSGAPSLCTVAWTNTTTRATALSPIYGTLANGASATCRNSNSTTVTCAQFQCTYVGTILTDASVAGQVDWTVGAAAGSGGTAARLGVWNQYNRRLISTCVTDTETSYTYSSATLRGSGNFSTTRVTWVQGATDDAFTALFRSVVTAPATTSAFGTVGIGLDSATATTGYRAAAVADTTTAKRLDLAVTLTQHAAVGLHYVQALEGANGTNAATFNVDSTQTLCFTGRF